MGRLIDAGALDRKLEKLVEKYRGQGREQMAQDYEFVRLVLGCAPTVYPPQAAEEQKNG